MRILFTILFLCLTLGVNAQKLSKAEKEAAKELQTKEKAEEDAKKHLIAVNALETNQWAFESNGLYDQNGRRLNVPSPDPNVVAFDGQRFFAFIVISSGDGAFLRPYELDDPAKFQSKKVDKKGNTIYKYFTYGPAKAECTVKLSKNSDYATVHINLNGVNPTFDGKIMPIKDCRYFFTYQRKNKKEK